MERFLFSLALVPVQEWIVEARRSRDLRAGSVFLWWLMAKVLAAVERFPEKRIVLPLLPPAEDDDGAAPDGGPGAVRSFADLAKLEFAKALQRDYGIPNRASGYFAAAHPGEAAARLAALETEVVRPTWRDWTSRYVETRASGRGVGDEEREFWKLAGEHFQSYRTRVGADGDCPFSLVWVAKPVPAIPADDDQELIARHLKEIEHLVRDVKRTRPIRPWPGGAPVGKCNQCGRREAMGPGESFDGWRDFHAELSRLEWVEKGFRLDAGERLCWVCFARRMAGYERGEKGRREGFPSTYQVAAAPWIELVREAGPELKRSLEELEQSLKTGDDVGSVVIQRLGPGAGLPEDQVAQVADRLVKKVEEVSRRKAPLGDEPTPQGEALPKVPNQYLALLAFDGDGMGRHVHEKPFEISAGMAEFGRLARQEIAEHQGAAFYLGGDEGLAMAPAIRALPLALALRKAFDDAFEAATIHPTLSLGLAFFQCTSPIAGAIRAAQDCLDRAKSLDKGKNALAVTVLTASGTTWTVAAHWGPDWDRLATAAEMVRSGVLAGGWAYDAERFVETAAEGGWDGVMLAPETVRDEVKRLLRRRLVRPIGEEKEKWKRDRALAEAWSALQGDRWWESRDGRTAEPCPEQFHLVGYLGRQSAGGAARGEER